MFSELPPEMRTRYAHVAEVCEAIRANYGRLSATSQMFVKQMEDKLQGLQQGYVRLLWAAHQQREYLQLTNPAEIQREQELLQKGLAADAPKVQEINRKRIEILAKRIEKFQKIRENRQVIDAQCAATEDVLQLIRDQSVTMRDPQQISDQLDNLVQDVEQTEQTVKEVEAIFEMATPDEVGPPLPGLSTEAGQAPRTRVRN
jgi:myosin heavy subunit